MNIQQLKSLVGQGESDSLEFKKTTGELKPAFEALCGFLNGKGGTVLIGVTAEGRIQGQDVSDTTRQEIAKETRKLEPSAHIKVKYVTVNGNKQVIILEVGPGNHAPYAYDGRAFERLQSSKGRMMQHRYEQLLIHRAQLNHSWEEYPADGYGIDSLDHEEILRTIQEGIRVNRIPPSAGKDSVEAALARLDLLDNGKLKNAAVVLFAKKTFPAYAQCELKMGRFRGISRLGDFIDNQQVYGNIFKLLSEADNFVMRHLPIASAFSSSQFERTDKPILPVLALREAMVNALCHKDYSELLSAVTLAIYDDRLEIWNYGALSPKLKLSDLSKEHSSFPRNKLIANVLYRREFFEKWGTGTNKMIDLCREQGMAEPEFTEYSGGLAVTFRFKHPIGATSQTSLEQQIEITPRQQQILDILSENNKMAVREIRQHLENPPAVRTLGDDLAYLKKYGLIDSEGVGRGAKWFLLKTQW